MHPNTRHKTLLEIERVNDWYENLRARSNLTADVYLRNFGLWLEWIDENPNSVVELATKNMESFRRKILKQIRAMEKSGKAGSYISVSLRPILSYLKFYDVTVRLNNINIKDEDKNKTVEQERVPTKEELESILKRANLRQNSLISLVAFSGLRPGAIGNYTGDDGLKVGDILDLSIEKEKVSFNKIPALIRIRSEISKSHKRYHTFLGAQGAGYIQEYLNQRILSGETLTKESALIAPDISMSRRETPNKFMVSTIVEREIKKAILKAGFNWRPYVFRHYFGVNLDASEGKGLISHSWRMHIMGHVGDIETTYSTDKPLPDTVIEQMREAFQKCLKFVETVETGIKEEDYQRLLREGILSSIEISSGQPIEEKLREDLLVMSEEDFYGKLRELYTQPAKKGKTQKVVSFEEAETLIEEGWEFIGEFRGKAIVKRPI